MTSDIPLLWDRVSLTSLFFLT